ncbi:MAG: hypothetical protein JW840_05235 [Candidatus Thermoplasmatota archaeon]|nr:hypothetical protein [Candidatus Thermoplasmatota archaeon]
MTLDFSTREKLCFDILKLLEKHESYVVIGGYAASSYGFTRFSVNLDVVIPQSSLSFFFPLSVRS